MPSISKQTVQAAQPPVMSRRPRLGAPETYTFPEPEAFRLQNGLQVLLLEKRDLPLVYVRLQLPVGVMDDPAGQPGVAYLTARMLTEGAGKLSAFQLAAAVQDMGAQLNAWADEDSTYLSLQVLRKHLPRGLDLLADVLLRPRLTASDFRRVMGVLKDRALQRRDQPGQVSHLALKAAVFGDHPYGRPLLAPPDVLAKRRVEELRAFHESRLLPGDFTVMVAGDVERSDVAELLEARLQGLRKEPLPRAEASPEPPATARPRLVLVDRPGSSQSVVRVGHLAPPRSTSDYAELQLLNVMLGGSFTSRLNQNLREKHGYTYGVHSTFYQFRRSGIFAVRTSVETENTLATVREILREMQGVLAGPPTSQEQLKARRLLLSDLPSQAETVTGLVDAYSEVLAGGLPLSHLQRYAVDLEQTSGEAVLAAGRRHLRPDAATVAVVGDLSKIRADLEAELGPAQLRDPDGRLK